MNRLWGGASPSVITSRGRRQATTTRYATATANSLHTY